jgi:hypothetical protein
MTTGGWINLILSLGFVLGLLGWCLWRLLSGRSAPKEEHLAHIELHHDEKKKNRR